MYRHFRNCTVVFLLTLLAMQPLRGQGLDDEVPNQLDILKVNITQLGINEFRMLYEIELREASSLELGLGYIYPNRLWFQQGGTALLATGGGIYAGFRKYRIPKRYFSTPFFRSYFSPWIFYRYSGYNEEWLLFDGGAPALSECAQFSERLHQLGAVVRMGWQTDHGRLVLDFYTGLGIKYSPAVVTQHALNTETDVCMLTVDSDQTEIVTPTSEVTVILNGGLKLGIRRDNQVRVYPEKKGDEDFPDTPPRY